MAGNTLICTLGLAPAVVTESLQELLCRGIHVDKVVCLFGKNAKPTFDILNYAFSRRFGGIRLVGVELPFEDLRNSEDSLAFRKKLAEVINSELSEGRRVYLCVSGGRKTMGFDALLVAQALGVDEVYHVVSEEHRGPTLFSALQDQFTVEDLVKQAKSDERIDELILDICDPRRFRYYLVRVPVPEISEEERAKMRSALGV